MNKSLTKWLTISFLNLLLVAVLGVLLRYKIAFYLPLVDQKFLLHSHSHFAFSGWITQTLMVLLVHYLSLTNGEQALKKYRWLLYANLITAYCMLISFFIQGYAFFSISFSTLSIFISYVFAACYWQDLNMLKEKKASHWWFKAALAFSVLSSIGTFGLAYMMANKALYQNWYLCAIYFFLHFQYNGWFFFAGMGLFVSKIEKINRSVKKLKIVFLLFCSSCFPAYFLSVLWLPLSGIVYFIIVTSVIAQLVAWVLMLKILIENNLFINQQFSKYGKILLLLSAVAFTIKLLLQSSSLHPALSQLSYSFRPIIIGYLHLVLLAVTTVFIIGHIISLKFVQVTKISTIGIFIFVAGIIINELLLMGQGIAAIAYTNIPYINIFLLMAAVILFLGASLLFTGFLKNLMDNN